jgi:hypothetical protein
MKPAIAAVEWRFKKRIFKLDGTFTPSMPE